MLFQTERLRLESIDQIATIWLDRQVMDSELAMDLGQALRIVRQSPCIDVLVLRGGKLDCFLTGPDLTECARLQNEIALRDFSMHGQFLLQRLERISETIPTVAYIDGRCTNIGMELALACDYRLAVARPETLLGFDPLARGWLPCWGATQRLPRLLGLRTATRLLTDGDLLPARAARKLGLVDHAFGPRPAKAEFNWFLADLQDHPRRPRRFRGQADWIHHVWEQTPFGRASLFDSIRAKCIDDPLALALFDSMERGAKLGPVEGYQAERRALVQTVLARKHSVRLQSARVWENQVTQLRHTAVPNRIAIVGLSQLGIELATATLRFGGQAIVWDSDESRCEAGLVKLHQIIDQSVSAGWWTIAERERKRKDLHISRHGEGAASVDLVFLTGFADEQSTFLAERECLFKPESVIVSTESTAQARVQHPERCLICCFDDPHCVDMIEPQTASVGAIDKLARWFDQCGYRVHGLPAVPRCEEKVAAFAA